MIRELKYKQLLVYDILVDRGGNPIRPAVLSSWAGNYVISCLPACLVVASFIHLDWYQNKIMSLYYVAVVSRATLHLLPAYLTTY